MKRWILLLGAFAIGILVSPSQGRDVASLRPVEILSIYKEADQLWVETDTGDLGVGTDLNGALEDLKQTASGEIFLDTADYVLVTAETMAWLPEVKRRLRPAAEIVEVKEQLELAVAAEFLSVHKPGLSLKDYHKESKIPQLIIKEGRYYLVE